MKKEIWKDINGFEGLYQVSSLGRVKSLSRKDKKGAIKPTYISYGSGKLGEYKRYPTIDMYGRKHWKRVHQLVAQEFIPNPLHHKYVNHKDGNKHNNHYSNLEWCTAKENTAHAYKTNLMNPYYKYSNEIVSEIRNSSLSNIELGKKLGINYKYIWLLRKNHNIRKNVL